MTYEAQYFSRMSPDLVGSIQISADSVVDAEQQSRVIGSENGWRFIQVIDVTQCEHADYDDYFDRCSGCGLEDVAENVHQVLLEEGAI